MQNKEHIFYYFIHTDIAPQCIWDIFYSTKPEISYTNEKNSNKGKNPTENSIFFFDCFFFDLDDGCVYIKDKEGLKFLHSFCRFSNITRSVRGGCIYFTGNMHIVQHRLCAYDIVPIYENGICYTWLDGSLDSYNYFLENSLTKCNNLEVSAPIYIQYGLIQFSSTNSSGNVASYCPGYQLVSPTSNSSSYSIVNYSTFEGNIAKYSILNHWASGFFTVTKSNILNNTNQDSGILSSSTTSTLVIDCNFFGNKGSHLFVASVGNIAGELIVKNCFIDNFTIHNVYGCPFSTESIETGQNTYILSHYSTYGCIAVLPQPINVNLLGISNLNSNDVTIPKTNSCKYKKFFRGSVKAKF